MLIRFYRVDAIPNVIMDPPFTSVSVLSNQVAPRIRFNNQPPVPHCFVDWVTANRKNQDDDDRIGNPELVR